MGNSYKIIVNVIKKYFLEYLGVDGRITLKWILKTGGMFCKRFVLGM
jgi:hypothetical protein